MKVRIKGVYAKHKTLADGSKVTYWYHRKTGARLPDDTRSPDFLERVRALNGGTCAAPRKAAASPPESRQRVHRNGNRTWMCDPRLRSTGASLPPRRRRSYRSPSP
jgi:hypothetical protein